MGLRYATITGVARDDLPDGGAWLYAETVRAIKELNPSTGVELLIPDFNGEPARLAEVFESRPEVLAHNVETVPRIFKRIRPAFSYQRSLDVLTAARDFGLVTKSNLILGLGETPDEVRTALADLHGAGCDIVTITQYLRPSTRHHPVERWVQARGVRRVRPARRGAGLRRGAGRAAGAVVLPGRPAVRAGRAHPRLGRRDAVGRIARGAGTYSLTMAKPRTAAENKAARAQAQAARKAAAKERRTQLWQAFNIQRQEDKRLLPYMIGAFVLIVAVSVAVGVWAGGLTMITLIPLGVVLGALVAFIIFGRRAQKSVYSKAEGQTGAAAWALDNLRGKWRVTPGVAATGHFDAVHRVHRPARRHLGRRRVVGPGQAAAGPGEEAHRAADRRCADLRHRRRQRRRRGSAVQAGAPPHPPAGQHHRQTDGHAGVPVGRAGDEGRRRRPAEGTAARTPARCAACSAPCAASSRGDRKRGEAGRGGSPPSGQRRSQARRSRARRVAATEFSAARRPSR